MTYTREQILDALRRAAREEGKPVSMNRWRAAARVPNTSTIIQRFGSWSAATEAAGLPKLPKGRPPKKKITWTPERVDRVYRLALNHLPPTGLDKLQPHLRAVELWRVGGSVMDDEIAGAADRIFASLLDAARAKRVVE